MGIGNILLDIIYPQNNICLFCGQNILFSKIDGFCTDCLQKINFLTDFCPVCGRLITDSNSICKYCQEKEWYFENARAVAEYSGLMKKIILYFKYFNKQKLAFPLGEVLSIYYNYYYGEVDIDYIIPIPLHEKKKELRGYNQAALLSTALSEFTGLYVLNNYLIRRKETLPLYNMSWQERKKIVKGVFALKDKDHNLRNKNVLLIDDIFTSGSTVNEAARVMKNKAGVNDVYVLTLATYSSISG